MTPTAKLSATNSPSSTPPMRVRVHDPYCWDTQWELPQEEESSWSESPELPQRTPDYTIPRVVVVPRRSRTPPQAGSIEWPKPVGIDIPRSPEPLVPPTVFVESPAQRSTVGSHVGFCRAAPSPAHLAPVSIPAPSIDTPVFHQPLRGVVSYASYNDLPVLPPTEFQPGPEDKWSLTRVFLGQLPLNITCETVERVCYLLSGGLRIYLPELITKVPRNNRGGSPVPTGCMHAYCLPDQCDQLIECLNRKALFDLHGVWHSANQQTQQRALRQYYKQLTGKQQAQAEQMLLPQGSLVCQLAITLYRPHSRQSSSDAMDPEGHRHNHTRTTSLSSNGMDYGLRVVPPYRHSRQASIDTFDDSTLHVSGRSFSSSLSEFHARVSSDLSV